MDDSIKKQLEAAALAQYLVQGSKLRNTVRQRSVDGSLTATFPSIRAGGKVECSLSDTYAGEWSDGLPAFSEDYLFGMLANGGAYALGRKSDELILDALMQCGLSSTIPYSNLTRIMLNEADALLGTSATPEDGGRIAVVGWKQWADLLTIPEFATADYVNTDDLPWKNTQAKRWRGTLWFPSSGLRKEGETRFCFWYHKLAVGHAIVPNVEIDVAWHDDRKAYFVNYRMAQGACLIDPGWVVCLPCYEQAAAAA